MLHVFSIDLIKLIIQRPKTIIILGGKEHVKPAPKGKLKINVKKTNR